jgi:hypothetical protein
VDSGIAQSPACRGSTEGLELVRPFPPPTKTRSATSIEVMSVKPSACASANSVAAQGSVVVDE